MCRIVSDLTREYHYVGERVERLVEVSAFDSFAFYAVEAEPEVAVPLVAAELAGSDFGKTGSDLVIDETVDGIVFRCAQLAEVYRAGGKLVAGRHQLFGQQEAAHGVDFCRKVIGRSSEIFLAPCTIHNRMRC